MKTLVIDLDGTLTIDDGSIPYPQRAPNRDVIRRLIAYKEMGFRIVVSTARNMRTHNGNVGLINVHTLPGVLDWLALHKVPYDEVYVGKPWCGSAGFYIDDKAIRPDEFVRMEYPDVAKLLRLSSDGD